MKKKKPEQSKLMQNHIYKNFSILNHVILLEKLIQLWNILFIYLFILRRLSFSFFLPQNPVAIEFQKEQSNRPIVNIYGTKPARPNAMVPTNLCIWKKKIIIILIFFSKKKKRNNNNENELHILTQNVPIGKYGFFLFKNEKKYLRIAPNVKNYCFSFFFFLLIFF